MRLLYVALGSFDYGAPIKQRLYDHPYSRTLQTLIYVTMNVILSFADVSLR
jgi:hypothetical protein